MSSIFKKPSPKPTNMGRNGFDLSRRRIFSAPLGMMLPVFKDYPNPGDKYRLNSEVFMRTEAVQTAAFTRFKGHVDWFFVPMMHLYSLWNEFFNGTQDVESSLFDLQEVETKVTLPLADVSKAVYYPESQVYFGAENATRTGFTLKVDDAGVPYLWNFRRLFDMLGYGSVSSYVGLHNNPNNNPIKYPLLDYLAYHKIFYSHFNKTDWFKNFPSMYNVDSCYLNGVIPSGTAWSIMSTIHYRPYRTDYFTNVMPQPLFSSSFASAVQRFAPIEDNVREDVNPESFEDDTYYLNSLSLYSNKGSESNVVGLSDGGSLSNITAADIRSVFALDKLLRITAFAGGHYEDQTLAHFGFKMPKGISKEAYRIGSQGFPVTINEVVATATTGVEGAGSTIGDIAGKGFTPSSNGGKDLEFTAPCHGVLMALFSIEVVPDYASRGCEVINRYREPLDFYRPEFDNLGMQPMFGTFTYVSDEEPNAQGIVGWTYRYSELKTSFDVVNESFWNTHRLDWIGYKQSMFKKEFNVGANMTLFSRLYIMPQYANDIFLQSFPYFDKTKGAYYDYTDPDHADKPQWKDAHGWLNPFNRAETVYGSDNFLVSAYFKCYKTSIMSTHSLPKLY